MSTTNEPNFDWSQAASLLGDDPQQVAEDMAEIARELIEGAESHLKELKKMNAETERKEIASKAHQLRGSLLNFGFTEVGEMLYQIEKGDYVPSKYPGLISEVERVFVASKKMFATRYSTLGLS